MHWWIETILAKCMKIHTTITLMRSRYRRALRSNLSVLFEATKTASVEFSPAAQVHTGLAAVLARIERGRAMEDGSLLKPNQEQSAFLRHFTHRLQVELGEQRADQINQTSEEPLLDAVLGPPGTGFLIKIKVLIHGTHSVLRFHDAYITERQHALCTILYTSKQQTTCISHTA